MGKNFKICLFVLVALRGLQIEALAMDEDELTSSRTITFSENMRAEEINYESQGEKGSCNDNTLNAHKI